MTRKHKTPDGDHMSGADRRYTLRIVHGAVDAVRRGTSVTVAARCAGVSYMSVRRWSQRAGVLPTPPWRDPQRQAAAVRSVAAGRTVQRVALAHGVSHQTIKAWCAASGVVTTTRARPYATVLRAVAFVRDGRPVMHAAHAVGVAASTVHRWCVTHGVQSAFPQGVRPAAAQAPVTAS